MSATVVSATSVLTFTLPTANVDLSPLPLSAITGIKIAIGTASGQYTKFVEDTALAPDAKGNCTYPVASLGLPPGTYYVALYTDSISQGQAEESTTSSGEVSFIVPAPPVAPNPPTNLSVF